MSYPPAQQQPQQYQQQQYQQQPVAYQAPMKPPMSGLAIAAFVCGLAGLAIIPIVLGHMAFSNIKKTGYRGSAFAAIGLVLGYFALVVYILLAVVTVVASVLAINS